MHAYYYFGLFVEENKLSIDRWDYNVHIFARITKSSGHGLFLAHVQNRLSLLWQGIYWPEISLQCTS